MHEHGYIEPGHANRLRDRALVAEVRQRDDDAVDIVAMLLEQRRTRLGFVAAFDGAVIRFLRADDHRVDAFFLERAQNLVAARAGEVPGKESAIADDHAERDALGWRT